MFSSSIAYSPTRDTTTKAKQNQALTTDPMALVSKPLKVPLKSLIPMWSTTAGMGWIPKQKKPLSTTVLLPTIPVMALNSGVTAVE